MTADFAADKLKDAVEPEKDRAQCAYFGQTDAEVCRQHWQDDADVDAPQIERTVGSAQSADH